MTANLMIVFAMQDAAKLLNRTVSDMELIGALPRYASVDTSEAAPGLRAEFELGQRCGESIQTATAGWSEEETIRKEGLLASKHVLKGATSQEELKALILALYKRAQIKTHTHKPGYEDINAWLDRMYDLYQNFDPTVDAYAAAISAPVEDEEFYDDSDSLIAALASGTIVSPADIPEQRSQYAQLLRDLCMDMAR
jgi:hypothetical protein